MYATAKKALLELFRASRPANGSRYVHFQNQIWGAHFPWPRAECHLRGTACSMSSVARKTDVSQTENGKGFERPVGKAGQSCVFFFGHSPKKHWDELETPFLASESNPNFVAWTGGYNAIICGRSGMHCV